MGGNRLRAGWKAWFEVGMAIYLTVCAGVLFFFDHWFERVSMALPFLAIFIIGYCYVAYQTFYTQWLAHRAAED